MNLSDLLAETSPDDLERIAHEYAHADEQIVRAQLLATIEGVLRSHRFLQEFLMNRQPPAFAIITLLLDAPEYALPTTGFRDAVLAETNRLCQAIDDHEILDREDQLRVYRRVLYQARSNDMLIDAPEAALLAVLRQELEVAQVEHFLIEHHVELREFWRVDAAFARELHALRSAGLVYVRDGRTLLPADLARVVRNVLGMDMSASAARRLYGHLSNQDLYVALEAIGAPTSGSKTERIERLVAHMAQPRTILRLRAIGLERLREICKSIGTGVSGSKDDVVDRVVSHFAEGRDLREEPDPPDTPPVSEPRVLDETRFALLFSRLRGHELATILGEFELRRWGTKELQVKVLWEASRSEETLLSTLTNSDLEGLLRRVELRSNGSKGERIKRLTDYYAALNLEAIVVSGIDDDIEGASDDVDAG